LLTFQYHFSSFSALSRSLLERSIGEEANAVVEVPSAALPAARGLEKQLTQRLAGLGLRPVTIRAAPPAPAPQLAR